MATVHLTEINDGQRMETHLCETCAQKQGLAVKNQIPLNELLSTLLSVQSNSGSQASPFDDAIMDLECPSCGMTLKRFREDALLGCPMDYEVFGEPLKLIIEKSQGGSTCHCGKVPSKAPGDTKKHIDLVNLKNELDEAVQKEDYEKAAKLRDQIEQLK